MSRNRLVFDGLEQLKRELRALPAELTAEASHEVEAAANAAAVDIRRAYPVRTGALRDNVFVTHFDEGRFSAGAIVKNTAKHAHLFENGTQTRQNAIGANRGAMPPGHVFVPRIIKHRQQMYERLKAMLARHGFLVSGDA